ncbi:MAG: hypothetical protein WC150_06990 [Bacteroidia bacterium]
MELLFQLLPSWFYTAFLAQVVLFSVIWLIAVLLRWVNKRVRLFRRQIRRKQGVTKDVYGEYADILFE